MKTKSKPTKPPYKALRRMNNIPIGGEGHLHKIWPIANKDMGICILILPDEDDSKKARSERYATQQFIVDACNYCSEIIND